MYMRRVLPLLFSLTSTTLGKTTTANATAFTIQASGATTRTASSSSSSSTSRTHLEATSMLVDPEYPGTAVERMQAVRERVRSTPPETWQGAWPDVRRHLLWAGGLRDLPTARPGQGYTGHSFQDFNHVDLTCMLDGVSTNENDGAVRGIAIGNQLGPGIRVASLPELGPGGSWSTCALGCHHEPPSDVAHVQFQSRIAFKLVWVPSTTDNKSVDFNEFVLVDDSGALLAHGQPTGALPPLRERQMNYKIVAGSKYAREADRIARERAAAKNVSKE